MKDGTSFGFINAIALPLLHRGFIALMVSAALSCAAVSPKFNATSPAGAQRGTETDIRFNGQRLEDTQEIVFYSPGFEVLKLEPTNNVVKARVKIAPDCRLGEHLVRLRTATGVSEVRTFYVGAYSALAEVEPNNDIARAQKIPVNVTVSGTTGLDDIDYFQIEAKKGDRISAEIEAMRLGRVMLDPYLSIHETNGTLLVSSDDTTLLRQDSALSWIAPHDGTFIIQVRDASYGGQANSDYRLHVGTFPRPTAVFPAGGPTGEVLRVHFIGDASGEIEQEVKLPDSPEEMFGIFAGPSDHPAPSPNWLRVSPFPNVLASPDNHSREQATTVQEKLPVALNGILSSPKQGDWFRFHAARGTQLEVSVFARRLRSPLDSVIEVYDPKGKSIAQNDDAGGPDSSLKFSPSEDGDYFVRITDQLGRGGPDYVYRVEITPSAPSLSLSIPQVARNDSQTRQSIVVPRGNRYATLISAKRNNFRGDLQFQLDHLPAGLKMDGDVLPSKLDAMPIVFEAAADAPIAGGLFDFLAAATNGVKGRFVQNIEFIYGQNNNLYYGSVAEKLAVAVAEEAPYKIEIVEPKVPLVQSGTMNLKIVATRKPGFDEAINLKMLWNPPGVGSQPDVTIPKGATTVDYPLNANGNAETATWKIAVIASANVQGGPLWVSSQLAKLQVESPFVIGRIDPLIAEPGQKTRLVCKLEQKQPFEGKATLKLMGLPEKISAPDKQITKDDTEVVFDLNIDADCTARSTRNLFCSALIPKEGELIPHNLASGGHLRIVPQKKNPPEKKETKVAATASGK